MYCPLDSIEYRFHTHERLSFWVYYGVDRGEVVYCSVLCALWFYGMHCGVVGAHTTCGTAAQFDLFLQVYYGYNGSKLFDAPLWDGKQAATLRVQSPLQCIAPCPLMDQSITVMGQAMHAGHVTGMANFQCPQSPHCPDGGCFVHHLSMSRSWPQLIAGCVEWTRVVSHDPGERARR